jgi:hypothetical protein
MKTKLFFTVIFFVLIIFSTPNSAQENKKTNSDFPVLKGPYLGQKPPGMKPEIFAPGIVSTPKYWEGRCTFSPDGSECYYNRREKRASRIMVTKLNPDGWSKPKPVLFSSEFSDSFQAFTPDGVRLFFNSSRPLPGTNKKNRRGIWYVECSGENWSEPQYFGRGTQVSISGNGTLYFRDPQYFQVDKILTRHQKDGQYTNPELLPIGVEGGGRPGHPWIAPDGSYLLFDTFHREGQGKGIYPDIYVCFRNNTGTWGKAINLGDLINKRRHNLICTVSPDGKYIFYSDEGDIYWVSTKIIEELKPKDL